MQHLVWCSLEFIYALYTVYSFCTATALTSHTHTHTYTDRQRDRKTQRSSISSENAPDLCLGIGNLVVEFLSVFIQSWFLLRNKHRFIAALRWLQMLRRTPPSDKSSVTSARSRVHKYSVPHCHSQTINNICLEPWLQASFHSAVITSFLSSFRQTPAVLTMDSSQHIDNSPPPTKCAELI